MVPITIKKEFYEQNKKSKKKTIKREKCRECDSTDLFTDESRGEVICGNCGIVQHQHVVDENSAPTTSTDHGLRIAQHSPLSHYNASTLRKKDRKKVLRRK